MSSWREALEELEGSISRNASRLRRTLEEYEETVQRSERELKLLRSIDTQLVRYAFALDDVFVQVVNGVKELTGATLSDLLLPRGSGQLEVICSSDTALIGRTVPIEGSVTGRVFTNGLSVRLEDVRDDGDYVELRSGIQSELAVPLKDDLGGVLGVINLEAEIPRYFSSHHQELAETLAGQAAIALRNARLYSQFMSVLDTFDDVQSEDHGLREVLSRVGQRAMELAGAEACQVLTVFGEELVIEFTTGDESPGVTRVKVQDSVSGLALRNGSPVRYGDLRDSEEARRYYKDFLGDMRSELAVPIIWKGVPLGVINLESPRSQAFTGHHERLVQFFAAQAAVAISNARSLQAAVWSRQVQSELWAMAQIGDAYGPMIHRLNSDAGAISAIVSEIRYKYQDLLVEDRDLRDRLTDIETKAEKVLEVPSKLKRHLEQAVAYEEIDIVRLAEQALDRIGTHPGIVFQRELQPVRNVHGSPQVAEVIDNLLMNSLDALPAGGTVIVGTRTWISRDRRGATIESGVELYIADTCGGISPEKQATLWQIGNRAKTQGRPRHLGFGLWWVKAFIERIGGTVAVEPEAIIEGSLGCQFTIRMPFKFRRDDDANGTKNAESATSSER